MDELIAELRERIVMGGGIGHIRDEDLAPFERLWGLYNQLLEEWCWRPIAEAPIPGPDGLPEYWTFPCLLQTASGVVGEGFARYATDNRTKGRKHVRVLRWYLGSNDRPRDSYVCKEPRYFQPLPQPKKD